MKEREREAGLVPSIYPQGRVTFLPTCDTPLHSGVSSNGNAFEGPRLDQPSRRSVVNLPVMW